MGENTVDLLSNDVKVMEIVEFINSFAGVVKAIDNGGGYYHIIYLYKAERQLLTVIENYTSELSGNKIFTHIRLGQYKFAEEVIEKIVNHFGEINMTEQMQKQSQVRELKQVTGKYWWEALYSADENCDHDIQPASGGGVKCTKCNGWFCF